MTTFGAFHWPDHVIGKRESRRIREEHNALYNSHADLLRVACAAANLLQEWREHYGTDDEFSTTEIGGCVADLRAAIAKARGEGE